MPDAREAPACGQPIPTLGEVRVVAARGLVKQFGKGRAARRVLDGADLDVHAGELVVVLGRSGSGKSTLLHLLGGLDRPEAGTIEIAATRVDRATERELVELRRRKVGFIFQFFHLIPELTGEENVLLAARLNGGRGARERHGRALISELGLAHVCHRLPHTLSGGEQQRFAIARALVGDPALVLADEPTGNLDTGSGRLVLGLLRAIADEGRAVVMASHEPEAALLADRVLQLRDGRLRC
jgi:ABC-type lipoprotein export system ATPase subunit